MLNQKNLDSDKNCDYYYRHCQIKNFLLFIDLCLALKRNYNKKELDLIYLLRDDLFPFHCYHHYVLENIFPFLHRDSMETKETKFYDLVFVKQVYYKELHFFVIQSYILFLYHMNHHPFLYDDKDFYYP